ncbi:hypothetical protein [Rhodopseudomonas sp. BR0M22]|uniref:hypothetical protein n=1 Tax=Rhodopseudomonas sp. BR0M22 TaxID=2269369 RepID=UPI0013DF57C4|nr:hypothetical protein [Rhodopseudomonas sp. BR0M22]NEW91443.1 hypothetical protein [Rhodopseudomonas sp. BR0M22]
MSYTHSQSYPFQIAVEGVVYDCVFVLTDDRLITVVAAGRRRSELLSGRPPRALAATIALDLVHPQPSQVPPSDIEPHLHQSWFDRLFERFRGVAAVPRH